ncbi:MAG: glycogen debranching enzyme N-terminal domain-containing protein [Bacteroidales bacterium]|nr:glycogen debranching enzyme N-terminal domain-containing protein [Bacteroidales bacterium]
MSYLKFDKSELVNLEYSLSREVLSTNKTGGYLNTTIIGCNTRKYHGLFVLPIENFEMNRYVLLSSMDETVIQHDQEFNLGIRCYGRTNYEPRGHKYIIDFSNDKYPTIKYRVGGVVLSKSMIFLHNKEQLLIKYTLEDAHSQTTLRLKPFLAFRSIHALTHANDEANLGYNEIESGASFKMYEGFPSVNIQLNKENEYYHDPAWYYNVVYQEEQRRGFEFKEDLFCPGYFELPIKKGESIIVSVSTSEVAPKGLMRIFNAQDKERISLDSYHACLLHAAKQFIVSNKNKTEIYAGYTWLGKALRETLLALPGLTLFADGDLKTFDAVLNTVYKNYDRQLMLGSKQVDSALWLFWVAQQYAQFTGDKKAAWSKFRSKLVAIAETFISGARMGVTLCENGLLKAKMNGVAMTWMNAYNSEGVPVTERGGFQVEVNALWYNAIAYLVDMETQFGSDKRSIQRWSEIKNQIEANFYNLFWTEKFQHLADYIDENGVQNVFTRPNQIFACALEYSPISEDVRGLVMEAVRRELFTVRGIRTLSPKNPLYKGVYDGNQNQRDNAYHQGSTRVWLISYYVEAFLKLYGEQFVKKAWEIINAFENDIEMHGVGKVCELYDGDPPHNPHGAISGAVAVAGLLRAMYLVNKTKNQ